MNPFDYIKALDHHAYFIHSFKDAILHLKNFLDTKFHISHKQNPDFYHEKFEVFGIEDSRKIKENHASRSFQEGSKRVFVIEAQGMTHEAQNSLLKIFEEPNENTHFFLIMPNAEILLSTLRSRLYIIKRTHGADGTQVSNDIQKFLKLSQKEKIAFVDDISKQITDEKLQKSDAMEFLRNLERVVYENVDMNKISPAEKRGIQAIMKASSYMSERSPSVKQLLEFVALSL